MKWVEKNFIDVKWINRVHSCSVVHKDLVRKMDLKKIRSLLQKIANDDCCNGFIRGLKSNIVHQMTFYEVLVKGMIAELKSLKFEANYYAKKSSFSNSR